MRSLFLICAFVLACLPVQSHAQDVPVGARVEPHTDVWIVSDRGGEVGQYLVEFTALARSRARVIIDGPCESACALLLGIIPSPRRRVTARERLGFHAARSLGQPGRSL